MVFLKDRTLASFSARVQTIFPPLDYVILWPLTEKKQVNIKKSSQHQSKNHQKITQKITHKTVPKNTKKPPSWGQVEARIRIFGIFKNVDFCDFKKAAPPPNIGLCWKIDFWPKTTKYCKYWVGEHMGKKCVFFTTST